APSEAAMSSLQEAAWGWLNSDLLRSTVPWFGSRQIDRGWALERSWEQRLDLQNQYVSDWALKTSQGLPAFNFNTTWVETGQPLVISTSNFPTTSNLGLTAFNDLWRDFDVRVSTAVRLSASFPFVSPASRPDGYAISYGDRHLVDGGYYDNFGLYSLIAWLDDAIHEPSYDGSRTILVLQIRSFPDPGESMSSIGRQRQGWFAQSHAPLDTMLNVRRAGQLRQAESLMKYFKSSEDEDGRSVVFPVDLVYDSDNKECLEPPLSWKLTSVQKGCVASARIKNEQTKMKCIRKFLSGDSTPDAEYPKKCWTI